MVAIFLGYILDVYLCHDRSVLFINRHMYLILYSELSIYGVDVLDYQC